MEPPGSEPIRHYQTVVSRSAPGDWDAIVARVEAARHLARAGFSGGGRAWALTQLATWRLHHRAHGRPTDPAEVCVLDTLFREAEAAASPVDAAFDPDPAAFRATLTEAVVAAARVQPDPVERMCRASLHEWRFLAWNMVAEAVDFTRTIALASLPLPHRHARRMYHNLWDESGRGAWADNHYALFAAFAEHVGVQVPGFSLPDDDDEALLSWTVPEVIAELNEHHRALWAPTPGPALGALFVVEHLVPGDFRPLIRALRDLGIPPSKLAYFEAHVEQDPGHADDWMEVVAEVARTPDAQRAVFEAAVRSARWYAASWQALCAALDTWVESGRHPTLLAALSPVEPALVESPPLSRSPRCPPVP